MAAQYPYPQGAGSYRPNSTMAIISLISGILGLTLLPVVGSIVAIITGFMAQKEIRDSRGELEGETLAKVGLILGFLGLVMLFLGLCVAAFFIAIPLCLSLGIFSYQYSGLIVPALLAFM
jgi:hypothetical protein